LHFDLPSAFHFANAPISEDNMDVLRRKKFPATFFQPTFASSCLTLRAVAISTGVVGDGAMSAASAFIEMPAEHGGATPRNCQEHFDMLPGDPLTASFDECVSRSADQIGHLQRWPVHLFVLRRPVFELEGIQRTRGCVQMALGKV